VSQSATVASFTEADLKKSFRLFMAVVWNHLGLPKPTRTQVLIANYLQYGPSRTIIEAFRGVGKSWITAAFVVWTLWNFPDKKVMIVSASRPRASDFSKFVHRLLNEIPMLSPLKPTSKQLAAGWRWAGDSFDVAPCKPAQMPSMKSLGITGQLAGNRADLIVFDDVEIENNSTTYELRMKLLNTVTTEGESILMPGGRITLLGTPQTHESMYLALEQGEGGRQGYSTRIWPAEYPSREDAIARYRGNLCPTLEADILSGKAQVGDATDPERFPRMELERRKQGMSRSKYALQFLLDTTLNDDNLYPLRVSDLLVTPLTSDKGPGVLAWGNTRESTIQTFHRFRASDPWLKPIYVDDKWIPYENKVMAIDPSGKGADETAWAVVAYLHGYLYVLDAGGLSGGYTDDNYASLLSTAKRFGVAKIVIEENFGGGMAAQLLRQMALKMKSLVDIEEIRSAGQKEMRIIDTLEPVMNRHKLVVDMSLVARDLEAHTLDTSSSGEDKGAKLSALFFQLSHLTRERGALKHDDRIDALSMAVAFFTDSVVRDEVTSRDDWAFNLMMTEWESLVDRATRSDYTLDPKASPQGNSRVSLATSLTRNSPGKLGESRNVLGVKDF